VIVELDGMVNCDGVDGREALVGEKRREVRAIAAVRWGQMTVSAIECDAAQREQLLLKAGHGPAFDTVQLDTVQLVAS